MFQDNSLVVGAGDNNVHVLDLEHGLFKVDGRDLGGRGGVLGVIGRLAEGLCSASSLSFRDTRTTCTVSP